MWRGRPGSEEAGTPPGRPGWPPELLVLSKEKLRHQPCPYRPPGHPAVQIRGSGVGEETPCKPCAPVSSLTHREVTRGGCDWPPPHGRGGRAWSGVWGPRSQACALRSSTRHLPLPPFALLRVTCCSLDHKLPCSLRCPPRGPLPCACPLREQHEGLRGRGHVALSLELGSWGSELVGREFQPCRCDRGPATRCPSS